MKNWKKIKTETWKVAFGFLSEEEAEDWHNWYAELDTEAIGALGYVFPDLPSLGGEVFSMNWKVVAPDNS